MLQSKVIGRCCSCVCVYVRVHPCIGAFRLRMCVCPSVCTSFIMSALFSLLSECLCLPVALIWSGHTGGQSHNTLGEGLCLVHLKDKSLRICSSPALPVHYDTDKAGKQRFVKHVTIKHTDIAETSPVLSDYSGEGFWFGNYGWSWWMWFHPSPKCLSGLFVHKFQFHPGIAIDCPCRAEAACPPSMPLENTALLLFTSCSIFTPQRLHGL